MEAEQIIAQAAQSGDGGSPIFWIMVGVVLCIQIADKIIYWFRSIKGKKSGGESHAECGLLAQEVKNLTKQISVLVNDKHEQAVQKERSREQIDSVYKWLSPDDAGEQKWKNAALHRRLGDVEGMIKSLINDCNASFTSIMEKLRKQ